MGRDALNCKHHKTKPLYEDDVLLGWVWFGNKCVDCGSMVRDTHPGDAIELGVYR